jgi:hypothetical protein
MMPSPSSRTSRPASSSRPSQAAPRRCRGRFKPSPTADTVTDTAAISCHRLCSRLVQTLGQDFTLNSYFFSQSSGRSFFLGRKAGIFTGADQTKQYFMTETIYLRVKIFQPERPSSRPGSAQPNKALECTTTASLSQMITRLGQSNGL